MAAFKRPHRRRDPAQAPELPEANHYPSEGIRRWPPKQLRGGDSPYDDYPDRRPGADPEVTGVAEVVGPLAIPQITVGAPSPVLEPTAIGDHYRSFPFRPDVTLDGWSNSAATVRGASQRGHLHRYNGAPRQDDFAIHSLPDGRIIAIVADGVSAAAQSHIGANLAVKYAAAWLGTHLSDDTAQTDWAMLMKSTAWELAEQAQIVFRLTEPDPVIAEEQFATTLICAVIESLEPNLLRAYLVGIGDSGAWILSPTGYREILGGKSISSDGVASSAVTGLPRVPKDLAPVVVHLTESDVLLIGSDGIGDPLGNGLGGVGNLLRDVLTPSAPSLIEFAHALDFSRENFDDDRTLVAIWPRSEGLAAR